MTLDASKEDEGKGGASPAPFPKSSSPSATNPARDCNGKSFVKRQPWGDGGENRIACERNVAGKKVTRESCQVEEQK